jgi:UDP-N-acetylglucosamine diphosphorylase/glucosamine-1-phosphate N-acetyltransferase
MMRGMHVVIFEGSKWGTFAPASLSRPVFCLASGMSTLLEKQVRYLEPNRLTLWVRPGMVNFCRKHVVPKLNVPTAVNAPLDDEPALLVSGRTLHFGKYEVPHEPAVSIDNEGICSAWTASPGLSPDDVMDRTPAWMELFDLPHMMPQSRLASYLWDLISWNEEALVDDAINLRKECPEKPAGHYHMINEEEVCLGRHVKIGTGCVLDASRGALVLDDGVSIGANSVVQGPCYVGRSSQVTPLSYVRAGTSIGSICKVGGEVSNTIFMPFSNKPHEGFMGDSYVGEWVNIGAGATTSNLKNTYGEIDVRVGTTAAIPTGRRFLGSMIGDHTKIAIGSRLMTGSYIGYCCAIAKSGLVPTTVPSLTFLTDKGAQRYERDKAREMITNVFRRRHREWEPDDEEMLRYAEAAAGEVEGSEPDEK